MIVLLGMEGQETHEMQGIRVFRVYREGLLAAKLGVEVPPGAEMLKAGLMERRRSSCRRRVPGCPGALGGGPAFAAVHQRIST